MVLLFDGYFSESDIWVDRNHFSSEAWGSGYNACLYRADSLIVEPAPEGRVGYAGKFTVRAGDNCNTPNEFAGIGQTIIINPGDEHWYSFSLYLPPGFVHTTWMNFWEIKTQDGGFFSAGISSNLDTGQFSVGWGRNGSIGIYSNHNQENVGLLTTGYSDWVIHVKWTNDNTGFIEYYKDGVIVSSHSNIPTLPLKNGLPVGNRFDFMTVQYRGAEQETRSIYIYRAMSGTTLNDVKYDIPPPSPPPLPQESGIGKAFLVIGGTLILREILKK